MQSEVFIAPSYDDHDTILIFQIGTSVSDTVQDPDLIGYNTVHCQNAKTIVYPLNTQNDNGAVFAFDFFPTSGTNIPHQTIFSIRNNVNLDVYYSVKFSSTSGNIEVLRFVTGSAVPIVVSSQSVNDSNDYQCRSFEELITIDAWNRIVVELMQAQPLSSMTGYSSARIWVNGVGTERTYFGNDSTGDILFPSLDDTEINFCSRKDPGTNTDTGFGDFQIGNFMYIQGTQYLYSNDSGRRSNNQSEFTN